MVRYMCVLFWNCWAIALGRCNPHDLSCVAAPLYIFSCREHLGSSIRRILRPPAVGAMVFIFFKKKKYWAACRTFSWIDMHVTWFASCVAHIYIFFIIYFHSFCKCTLCCSTGSGKHFPVEAGGCLFVLCSGFWGRGTVLHICILLTICFIGNYTAHTCTPMCNLCICNIPCVICST